MGKDYNDKSKGFEMMMKKILLVLVFMSVQLVQAEENLYAKHYKEQNGRGLKSLLAEPDTKMYVSNHSDEDNIDMLENGYDMMGSTGFEAGSIMPDMALVHAKSIKADIVLVYSKYASKKSSLSKLQLIKEAAKTTGEIDAEVLKEDEEKYSYYASYWAKVPMPLLGLHVIKLKHKDKDGNVIPLDGLKILAVIKGSAAFKAGLKRGDVLTKLGDFTLQEPEELGQVVGQYQGKQVDVVFKRGDEIAHTKVQLNTRK